MSQILRTQFKATSITQTELGDGIGVSQSQMSKILRGERTLTIDQLEQICFILGLTPGVVVDGADPPVDDQAELMPAPKPF